MSVKRTALAAAIALTVAGGPAWALTSTVGSQFILDKTEITGTDNLCVNLALLGLNRSGQVDIYGEEDGSVIIGTVSTELGRISSDSNHPGEIPNDVRPGTGSFAADAKYIRLVQGRGQANICYDSRTIGTETRIDNIDVILQERVPTGDGGVDFIDIGQAVTKNVSIDPANPSPTALRIAAFKPGVNDPRGVADCISDAYGLNSCAGPDALLENYAGHLSANSGMDNGVMGEMMVGQNGGQILVLAENSSASGQVTVTLRSKDGVTGQEYSYSQRMEEGRAIVTLDGSVTNTDSLNVYGEYYIEATFEGFEGNSVQLVNPDILRVWSKGVPRGLGIMSDKTTIVEPTAALRAAGLVQGAYIMVNLLDEYGNPTTNCNPVRGAASFAPADFCRTTDAIKVVIEGTRIDNSVRGVVPGGSTTGMAMMDAASGSDMILGNAPVSTTEEVAVGTYTLNAIAVDDYNNELANIAMSDELAIKVVPTSIQATSLFDVARLAGTEFDFATVVIMDGDGTIRIDPNTSVPADPGPVRITNLRTQESIIVNRKSDGSNNIQGLFKQATWTPTQFLIGDAAGLYGQIVIDTAAVVPAAATVVGLVNAHGQEVMNVDPIKRDKQFVTVLPDVAFHMFDDYGNAINTATGEFRVTAANASDINYSNGNSGVPRRTGAFVEISYDGEGEQSFAGQDVIQTSFTKPGLGETTLDITTNVPALRELGSIVAHIERTTIPVNSTVALTVETLDQNGRVFSDELSTITVNFGGENDSIIPTLRIVPTGAEVRNGQAIDFGPGGHNGRIVFEVDAGARVGQFTVTFGDANLVVDPVELVFETTLVDILPDDTEETCNAQGFAWDNSCNPLPSISTIIEGSSASLLNPNGVITFGTSNAQFNAGWSFNNGPYGENRFYGGEELGVASVIRFAPEHIGQTVDIIILLDFQLGISPSAPRYWYQVSLSNGFVIWDEDLVTLEGFEGQGHEIVASETVPGQAVAKAIGPYNLGVLGLPVGYPQSRASFYFGYRLDDGFIHFGSKPITLTIPEQ